MAGDLTVNNLTCATVNTKTMATHVLENGLGGSGQTWQDMTISRLIGTTYTNSTGKPIIAIISFSTITNSINSAQISINGVAISFVVNQGGTGSNCSVQIVIPNGAVYIVANSGNTYLKWFELR
jgi:hypothetical protein